MIVSDGNNLRNVIDLPDDEDSIEEEELEGRLTPRSVGSSEEESGEYLRSDEEGDPEEDGDEGEPEEDEEKNKPLGNGDENKSEVEEEGKT